VRTDVGTDDGEEAEDPKQINEFLKERIGSSEPYVRFVAESVTWKWR
jgi:hypothetical protein